MIDPDFHSLYAAYSRPVRNFLFRLGARASLDDLTQETFMRVWANREKLPELQSPKAWILKIALHQFYDLKKRKSSQSTDEFDEVFHAAPARESLDARLDAEKALLTLPLEQRSVCILHYLEDLTVVEIAHALEIPEGTVKTRLMKSRERMLAVFSPEKRHV